MNKPNKTESAVATPKKIRTNVRAGGLFEDMPRLPDAPPRGPDGEPLPPWWV